MSLPSSPHEYRAQISETINPCDFVSKEKMVLAWNKVLQSSPFLNKPLLPFEEWNIDFSELTIGTRVGIGKLLELPQPKLPKSIVNCQPTCYACVLDSSSCCYFCYAAFSF